MTYTQDMAQPGSPDFNKVVNVIRTGVIHFTGHTDIHCVDHIYSTFRPETLQKKSKFRNIENLQSWYSVPKIS